MYKEPNGGPAFPATFLYFDEEQARTCATGTKCGMTLRDWFAGHAMAAIVAHQQHGDCEQTSREELADCAYEVADALLAVRDTAQEAAKD